MAATVTPELERAVVGAVPTAVGQFYERFDQTSDDEVMELLAQASARAEART